MDLNPELDHKSLKKYSLQTTSKPECSIPYVIKVNNYLEISSKLDIISYQDITGTAS